MAEFKLGRIRFVWKGEWAATTIYYVDDVVRYGGKTFICRIGHTADANFYTDRDVVPTKWDQMSDGQEWKDEWATGTFYAENDIVKYGGTLYICNNSHTSAATAALGLEANSSDWDVYAEGFDWKEDWASGVRYKRNDLVKYGGYTYIANTGHTSGAFLEDNQSLWDEFNKGLEYKGTWSASGTRYKVNDVVKYGAGLWICTDPHTSTVSFTTDQPNWDQFLEGFEFEEEWNVSTQYQPGDVVRYGGNLFIARTNTVGTVPSTSTSNWTVFSEGFNWSNDWDIANSYRIGDVVKVGGFTYLAIQDSSSFTKNVTATTAGTFAFTGNTTGLVENMAVRFSGTTFGGVLANATYYIKTILGGSSFTISTVPGGAVFVPTTATGSMTAIAAAHPTNGSYFQSLTSGIRWRGEWVDDFEYDVGDAVRYGTNAYVCLNKHRSEGDDGSTVGPQGGGQANSRPDLDNTGTYWEILSVGSEISVLTTRGDLVYYGGAGPTRLPIGVEGQVLQAGTLDPQWVSLGSIDFVYYVATDGTDHPAPIHGKTLDKPWKTIRYACEQVLEGPRNPRAKRLLEMNRVFIQREVTSWIDYQVEYFTNTVPTPSSIWFNFDYDEAKCERDTGFLIDRLIYDIGHGGNLKIRSAAQTYLNVLDQGPFSNEDDSNGTGLYVDLASEADQHVEAFNYMLTLIDKVMANEVPDTVYQNITDDSSAIADQHFEIEPGESEALTEINSLMNIIITAIDTQDPATIPERYTPTNLIRIATGRYRETLPIIVPAYTCVLGDELRSTNAGPAGSLVDIADTYYTINTFDRIKAIVGDIVEGTAVTPTTGNTETQSIEWPYADDTITAQAVESLVDVMKHQSDFRVGTLHVSNITDPVGYNSSYLVGYGDARELLKLNRKFLQEEVVAFMQATYPTLKYSKTLTRRDAGYIIDALIYDLTYGGNALSVLTGKAYYDGDDNTIPQISASIKAATIAAIQFLKARAQSVAQGIIVPTPSQTAVDQLGGTAGSGAAATLIGNNIDDIVTIVDEGPAAVGTTVTLTDPAATNLVTSTTALINANSSLQSAVPTIQTAVIDYINSNFGSFTYDSAICRRDTGLLIDASYYDTAFGSNFWAVQNGISFYRPQSSKVIAEQLTQKIAAVNFIKEEAAASLASNTTAVSRSNDTYDEIVDILTNGVSAADSIVYTNPGVDANALIARQNLVNNRQVIIDAGIAWINSNFPSLVYDEQLCRRDIGYTVDALAYDAQYGGNLATKNVMRSLFNQLTDQSVAYPTANERTAGAAFYTQLGVITGNIVRATGSYPGQNTSAGDAGATYDTLMDTLNGYISTAITNDDNDIDSIVADSAPVVTWAAAGIQTAVASLLSDKNTIVASTLQYLTDTFSSLVYNHAKCSRDISIILKAVGYDFMFNSNYQTVKAAHSYLRPTATEVYTLNQKAVTRAAIEYALKTLAVANVGGNTTAQARINSLASLIDVIIFGATNEGDICQSENRMRDYAALQLERNRNFIIEEARAHVADTYRATVTATNASNDRLTVASTAWLRRNTPVRFTGTVFGGVATGITYYVQRVVSSTEFTIAATRDAADSAVFQLSTDGGSMTISLYYNQELCLRDVGTYIDALKYDLKFPGNYRSRYVARYYANAVLGSLEEDMFYLRDATGVRDMTLEGLTGDMTPENEYGTSRVTAGAYCSLDPGWGPDDFTAWILSRSPYVQGVTTIGYGAIGQKIDGALHNGGNDSIVSNDFTQVISDGIGAWVANNGRAELVSVFTYYSHIGYLSTEGGRIRGTNGNNSYGDFGSVAEGFDATEIPNSGVVDNRFQFVAEVGEANTDGDEFLNFEFINAGIDYTEVNWTITGGGLGAVAEPDEFRDDAVYQVRLLDLGNDSSGQFGGDGYITNSNTAQGGTTTSITIAATDSEPSSAYVGMKIYLNAGTGVGQYGIISTYNTGTKLANVVKESDGNPGWDHLVPGTTIASPDASTTYTIEPRLIFSAPGFSSEQTALAATGTWSKVKYGYTAQTYLSVTGTYTGAGVGANFTVIRNGWKYIPSVQSAGTGYSRLETIVLPGTSLGGTSPENDLTITITAVNALTGAIIDFDWEGFNLGGVYVAIRSDSTNRAAYSTNGTTWVESTLPTTGSWTALTHGLIDDGSTANKVSRFVAIRSGSNKAAWSEDGITWNDATLPVSANWTSVAFGEGRFVAVSSNSTTVAISLDGQVWDITGTIAAGGFADIAYGMGLFVAVRNSSTIGAVSTDGVTWSATSLPNSAWVSVTWGNGKFVAVSSNSNNGAYSLNGTTWTAMTLGSVDGSSVAGYQQVAYGQGLFMATAYLAGSQDYAFVETSEDGIFWTTRGVQAPANAMSGYSAIAFGNPQRTGRWVILNRDSGAVGARITTGARAKGRAAVAENKIFLIRISEPGSGYTSTPTMTIIDPNNTFEAPFTVRVGKGALATPSFKNRGSQYTTGSAEVDTGDGYADNFQSGGFIAVRRLTARPVPGSNIVFDNLPDRTFKLVNVITFLGQNDGSYTAFFQVSPILGISESPEHLDDVTTRIRYSQVRLTGHDFLDIGTGGFEETNYPGTPDQDPIPANETVENNGGRVFYTSTDQDGNFRVGNLFAIEQSTGVATLNADAFNISGLQELNLGNVTLGGGSATITEFSTDPFFTADSDNIVPTQRAIKAYIAGQIGGGGAALNVNSVTAGSIKIDTNQITTTTGGVIEIDATLNFNRGVIGVPLAFNYFLQ